MTTGTLHTTWLSLIDRSGPFLSIQVLEAALPQGLEAVQTKFKQKLRIAYEEWRDAVDSDDPQLAELHKEWIRLVLTDILEYDNSSLILNSSGDVKYTNQELASDYSPTFVVKSPASDKIRFFIDVLPPDFDFDKAFESNKWPASSIEKMTLLCRSLKVRYGLLTNGEKWTIVSAPIGATSGTATWYSRLWRYEPITLKAFQTLLGVRRCFGPENGNLDTLLDSSLSSYEEVTNTLGEQVRRAVEVLIQSLDSADQDRNRELLEGIPPSELYDASVTVMMRLVFLLCAEERGLLLLGDPIYDQFYAVTTLRSQLAEEAGRLGPEVLERRHDAWSRLLATFRAVYGGIEHESLRLPPMGGSLFDPDKYPFLEGRKNNSSWKDSESAPLPIDNRTVLLLLTALQILEQKGGALHLSYRALDVEQIGHVYEGLLECTVKRVNELTFALVGAKGFDDATISESEYYELRSDRDLLIKFLEERTGRGRTAIEKLLSAKVDEEGIGKLLIALQGRENKLEVAKDLYFILKNDIWGTPLVYKEGSYAVVRASDRSDTGTHYTPKILTEEIVNKTLGPLIYDENKIKTSKKILDLRICDMAMGSAAFLVQACRFLSEALVSAWGEEEKQGQQIGVNGLPIVNSDTSLIPSDTHDRLILARRLISERCLFGVDYNALAVELSKLSLWLVTMSKGLPFNFLDHNLKRGDSLLGIHSFKQLEQISYFDIEQDSQSTLFLKAILDLIQQSLSLRETLEAVQIKEISDVQMMSEMNEASNSLTKLPKEIANQIINESLLISEPKKLDKSLKKLRVELENIFSTYSAEDLLNIVRNLHVHQNPNIKNAFHWPLEFPEVFKKNGGFDAVLGNPPYLGGLLIANVFGRDYYQYLSHLRNHRKGNPDLGVFFLLRAFSLLKPDGAMGMVVTSSLRNTGNKQVGFDYLLSLGANIYWAIPLMNWPGSAKITVSTFSLVKGNWNGKRELDSREVPFISGGLDTVNLLEAVELTHLKGLRSEGFNLLGEGFVLTAPEKEQLIAADSGSSDVIFPYFRGEDIVEMPTLSPKQWAIDYNDINEDEAQKYPLIYERVKRLVEPCRTERSGQTHQDCFWKYWDMRPALRNAQIALPRYLVASSISKYLVLRFYSGKAIFNKKSKIIFKSDFDFFGLLQSTVHDIWVRWCSGARGATLAYSSSKALATFPLPTSDLTNLKKYAEEYYIHRDSIFINRQVGPTEIYNLFHSDKCLDEDLNLLRNLRQKIDHEVFKVYGWDDLDSTLSFYSLDTLPKNDSRRFTLDPEVAMKILDRLLDLNHKQANCEQQNRQEKNGKRKRVSLDADEEND